MTKDFWIGYSTAAFIWLAFAFVLGSSWEYPLGGLLIALWFVGKRHEEEKEAKKA